MSKEKDCPDCWGSGWATQFITPCVRCNGTGKVSASPVLLPKVEEKKEFNWAKVVERSVSIMRAYATLVAHDTILKATIITTSDILSSIPIPLPNTPST